MAECEEMRRRWDGETAWRTELWELGFSVAFLSKVCFNLFLFLTCPVSFVMFVVLSKWQLKCRVRLQCHKSRRPFHWLTMDKNSSLTSSVDFFGWSCFRANLGPRKCNESCSQWEEGRVHFNPVVCSPLKTLECHKGWLHRKRIDSLNVSGHELYKNFVYFNGTVFFSSELTYTFNVCTKRPWIFYQSFSQLRCNGNSILHV